MQIHVGHETFRLNPHRAIGKGGEADVYALRDSRAVKIWKRPAHADYRHSPDEQSAARRRIAEYQEKLPAFPQALPPRVLAPDELAVDRRGQIVGFTMPLLGDAEPLSRLAERNSRAVVGNDQVRRVFLDLHETLTALHARGVVVGDFNDLNVLVHGESAHLIDADSMQFGRFLCRVFTARFVDPLLCDAAEDHPTLCGRYAEASDWYAFEVMLMQSLLFVGPYGGIHRPANPRRRIGPDARPLRRVTIFHPEVRYPKPAVPYAVLPDELLHHFHETFVNDRRSPFPRGLLESLHWTKCPSCHIEHARAACPKCRRTVPAAARPAASERGNLVAKRLFRTQGAIVAAAWQDGRLRWLVHEQGKFLREDGSAVLARTLAPRLEFALRGEETLVACGNTLLRLTPGEEPSQVTIDAVGLHGSFAANASHCYWVERGRLLRDGRLGPQYFGDVLEGQTRIWVGEAFGFGFYRAGELNAALLFDARRPGICEIPSPPSFRGELIDAACAFAADRVWFFTTTREAGVSWNRCRLIGRDGALLAEAAARCDEPGWLATIHGNLPAGEGLLAATDEGVVRLEPDGGRIVQTRSFPDAEPFVDSSSRLVAGRDCLHVVGQSEIHQLQLEPATPTSGANRGPAVRSASRPAAATAAG